MLLVKFNMTEPVESQTRITQQKDIWRQNAINVDCEETNFRHTYYRYDTNMIKCVILKF